MSWTRALGDARTRACRFPLKVVHLRIGQGLLVLGLTANHEIPEGFAASGGARQGKLGRTRSTFHRKGPLRPGEPISAIARLAGRDSVGHGKWSLLGLRLGPSGQAVHCKSREAWAAVGSEVLLPVRHTRGRSWWHARGRLPPVRLVALAERDTHAIFALPTDADREGEATLSRFSPLF